MLTSAPQKTDPKQENANRILAQAKEACTSIGDVWTVNKTLGINAPNMGNMVAAGAHETKVTFDILETDTQFKITRRL